MFVRQTRVLRDTVRCDPAAGVPCEGEYVFDNRPYAAIAGAATKHHCDLIVMDAHTHNGIERLMLSNVTHKVILCCDVPVLVCH